MKAAPGRVSSALASRRQEASNSATSMEIEGPRAVIRDCQTQVARRLVAEGQGGAAEEGGGREAGKEEEREPAGGGGALSSPAPFSPSSSSSSSFAPPFSLSPYHTSASPGGAGTTWGCAVEAEPKPSILSSSRDTPVVEGALPGSTRPPSVAGAGRVSSERGSSSCGGPASQRARSLPPQAEKRGERVFFKEKRKWSL